MLYNRISLTGAHRWISSALMAFLPCLPVGQVLAEDRAHRLQGLFCNSEQQIDETLAHMSRGLAPRAAVALTNVDAVVCTFVDLLHYVVDRPVVIKEIRGTVPFFKYEGTLIAVVVGGAIRPVTPPVRIFFLIPERLADAPLEGRA
jgi:hypothetical protein